MSGYACSANPTYGYCLLLSFPIPDYKRRGQAICNRESRVVLFTKKKDKTPGDPSPQPSPSRGEGVKGRG